MSDEKEPRSIMAHPIVGAVAIGVLVISVSTLGFALATLYYGSMAG